MQPALYLFVRALPTDQEFEYAGSGQATVGQPLRDPRYAHCVALSKMTLSGPAWIRQRIRQSKASICRLRFETIRPNRYGDFGLAGSVWRQARPQ
jgi:formylglycine-generating enzyme required for sulfatase activity